MVPLRWRAPGGYATWRSGALHSLAFDTSDAALSATTDASQPAQIDTTRQALAARYARQQHVLALVNLGVSAAVIVVLLLSGLSVALRDALAATATWTPLAGWHPLLIATYFLVLFGATSLLGAPLSYYGGFVLPHRYGLATQHIVGWLIDQAKGLALSLVFEVAAVELVYALLALLPDTWWLWIGLAALLFTVVLANLAPVLFLPIFYKLTPLPDGVVRERALQLAAQAHTRVRGIYSMNLSAKTTAANAMVIGLGNTRRIVLGDTLLDRYTADEIEVVVAHELGHQVHRDIPKLIAFQVAMTLVGLYLVNLVLHSVVASVHSYTALADAATMPLVGATLGVFALAVLPLTNGFSRFVERQADAYALQVTRKPDAFISAMTRLANQNLSELAPAPIIEFLLYNHPSIGRRVAFARRYAEQHTN